MTFIHTVVNRDTDTTALLMDLRDTQQTSRALLGWGLCSHVNPEVKQNNCSVDLTGV